MSNVLSQKWDQLESWLCFRNKALMYIYGATLALHFFVWGIFFVNLKTIYQPTKEFITLHYKVGIGPDYIGPWYVILAIPLLGLVIAIVNCILSRMAYHHDRFSVFALAITALIVQIVLGWVLYLIVKANLF